MNRFTIIGAGAVAFVIAALVGAFVWDGAVVASAIYCGLAVALVVAAVELFARPERERQVAALEQLAAQGRALPDAADALGLAVTRLSELQEALASNHAETVSETQAAVRETVSQTQAAVREAVGEASTAVREAVGEASAAVRESAAETQKMTREGADRTASVIEKVTREGADRTASVIEKVTREGADHTASIIETVTREAADRTAAVIETAVAEAQRTHERVSDEGRAASVEERKETARVLRETAGQIREDLTKGVADAAKASQEAVAPVAAEAMKTATTAATVHLASIQRSVEDDAVERRRVQAVAVEALDAHLKSIEERLDAQLTRRADADAKVLIAIEAHARNLRENEERRAAELAAHWATMSEAQELRVTELALRVEEMSAAVNATLAETANHDAERGERLSEMATQIQDDLGAATTVVREHLEASATSDAAREKTSAALLDRVSTASAAMADATAQQCAALEAFAEAADGRVVEAEERGSVRIADLALRFEAAAEAQQKRLAVFESELADRQRAGAETLASHLADHARGVDTTLRETADLVREAAGLVHAGGGEMTAVAEMFAGAVDKQRDAANTWIESLGKIDAAVVDAGETAAVDVLGNYLARTHELFDQQLGFQQELFEQLTVGGQAEAVAPPA